MKGKDLKEWIEKNNLEDIDISVNFSYRGDASYVFDITRLSIECTELNGYIEIGKIDELMKFKDEIG